MQLPDAEEFAKEYDDDEELVAKFPDRPVTSLRDIQYVYGKLYTLATVGGGEYAPYLTPDQATDLLDEGDSLIVVRVDLSGDEPHLDTDEPVQVKNYKRDLIPKVAHSYCYNKGNGYDYSITERSGGNKEPHELAEYPEQRFTRWATDDAVHSVAKEHEDGWIIEMLSRLGEDEDAVSKMEDEVIRQVDGNTTALITVQIKTEDEGEYQYPGEIEVLNEAMKHRFLSRLASKGNEADNSRGEAIDMVSDESGTTVGTATTPLNYYLGKQLEKFPGFDIDEAWRTHPISGDSALNISNSTTFVNACTYSPFGVRKAEIYYLPYFLGVPKPDQLRELYRDLYAVVNGDEGMTPVERTYIAYNQNLESVPGDLRFYVTAVQKHQDSRYDVYGDTMHGSIHYPVKLADRHMRILDSWVFNDDAADDRVTAAFGVPRESDSENDWRLLRGDDLMPTIATGSYFYNTFPVPDEDENASADDARIQALVSVLSGDEIEISELLKEYADRLTDETGDSFPQYTVASQYAQLCALAEAGLLKSKSEKNEAIAKPTRYLEGYDSNMTEKAIADGGTKAAARERKLAQFLKQTPALDDDERRGAFLLGVLVGQVTGVQQSKDRGTTLIDQYPVKAITKSKFQRITEEVLDKDIVYSRERNKSSTIFKEVVDPLRNTLLQSIEKGGDITDWGIRTEDLRFYYALGVTYGMNSYVSGEETDNEEN